MNEREQDTLFGKYTCLNISGNMFIKVESQEST